MSLAKDVTEIKKILEALPMPMSKFDKMDGLMGKSTSPNAPVFKAASKDQLANRQSKRKEDIFAEMLSKCRYPIHDKIKLHLSLLKDYLKVNDRKNIIDELAELWTDTFTVDSVEYFSYWNEAMQDLDQVCGVTASEGKEIDKLANDKIRSRKR